MHPQKHSISYVFMPNTVLIERCWNKYTEILLIMFQPV